MPKSKSDMSNHPNPLPCGCGAVGTPDMDTLGTKMEYRNIHVRLCPLHAAAPAMAEYIRKRMESGDIEATALWTVINGNT